MVRIELITDCVSVESFGGKRPSRIVVRGHQFCGDQWVVYEEFGEEQRPQAEAICKLEQGQLMQVLLSGFSSRPKNGRLVCHGMGRLLPMLENS